MSDQVIWARLFTTFSEMNFILAAYGAELRGEPIPKTLPKFLRHFWELGRLNEAGISEAVKRGIVDLSNPSRKPKRGRPQSSKHQQTQDRKIYEARKNGDSIDGICERFKINKHEYTLAYQRYQKRLSRRK